MMRSQATVALLLLVSVVASAAGPESPPAPPTVAARSHILVDYQSGLVLSETAADTRSEPASLTKIMTAYVAFDELRKGNVKLTDQARVSEKAWRTGGSRMFIDVGKTVSVDDLLKGVIIQSGNDATVALAEHVAGSEEAFAALMNRHAERLGLTSTHFANANGLPDPSQHTTARDLATLSAAMIRDFPEYYPLHAVREFKFNNIVQHNRNRLLNLEPGVDGIKTGHTEAAGYCLVASGEREGMRLIAVILGAASEKVRVAEASKLLGYGFRFYEARKLHAANTALVQAPLWKGAAKTVDLGLERDLYLTVPRAQPGDISVSPEVDPLIVAPVARGERKGTVKVRVNGKDVLERPLVVLQDVRPGNFLRRWLHAILLFFHWW